MGRVIGIGGVFFKAKDPKALSEWYRDHLGFSLNNWGGVVFEAGAGAAQGQREKTAWSLFAQESDYFSPSTQPFMINYRVDDLDTLLAQLRADGCTVDAKVDESTFGKFGWVIDPEGNRIELWQPPTN